jgi:hypothetical protein
MPASHVHIDAKDGLRDLYCPVCSSPIFTADAGAAEDLCDHICFFIDWAGEITLASPENYTGDEERRQQTIVDLVESTDDWDEFVEKAVKALGDSAIVMDIEAPTIGADEDGTRVVVAIDFALADVASEDE